MLRVSAYLNPSTLDPFTGRSGADHPYLFALYDTLVDFEPSTLKPRPGLASWSFPDPKIMVLELRPAIHFHDGTPCDADAVRVNIERARMVGTRSTVTADLDSVASSETGGPLKVVLHLKYPNSALPAILSDRAGMMMSPTAQATAGDDFDRRPCGTGQLKFVSWADGDRVIMTRNDEYWKKGEPYLDGITFRVITDYTAGAHSVEAGENDFMWNVPPRLIAAMKSNRNVKIVGYPSTRVMNIFFNYGRPPLNDVRVRQAINYAIDRVGFTRVTTEGTGQVASSLAPAEYWAFDKEGAKRYPYDAEKAKALLKDAGYEKGLNLTMVVLPDAEYRRRADIAMDNLNKVGINLTLMPVQQATHTFNNEKKGDIFLVVWTGRPDLSRSYFALFSKDSYYNASGTTPIDNIDELISATTASEDLNVRKVAFAKLMQAERDAALFAPLCTEQMICALRSSVKGFVPNLLGKPKFDGVFLDT